MEHDKEQHKGGERAGTKLEVGKAGLEEIVEEEIQQSNQGEIITTSLVTFSSPLLS